MKTKSQNREVDLSRQVSQLSSAIGAMNFMVEIAEKRQLGETPKTEENALKDVLGILKNAGSFVEDEYADEIFN